MSSERRRSDSGTGPGLCIVGIGNWATCSKRTNNFIIFAYNINLNLLNANLCKLGHFIQVRRRRISGDADEGEVKEVDPCLLLCLVCRFLRKMMITF